MPFQPPILRREPLKQKIREGWVFVAYPYDLDSEGYRGILTQCESEYAIRFRFADDTASATHLSEKVKRLVAASDVSMFDVSGWNANVAYEFGIYVGMGRRLESAWLFLNTTRSSDVPADIRGFSRNHYSNMDELRTQLARALRRFTRRGPNIAVLPRIR